MIFSSYSLRCAAVGLAVFTLAGCTADTIDNPQSPVVSPTTPGSEPADVAPKGPVPPGLERFYSQQLSWGDCEEFATTELDTVAFSAPGLECTRVEVPLDYADPQRRTAGLGLLRRVADDPGVRVGSLVLNPGGPGASGMSTAAALSVAVADTELGRRFDLVGFDPRGIGASEPKIICRTTEEQDAERLDLDVDTSPTGVEQTEAEERDYAALCAARVGTDVLATSGTRDVARDMDILRAVLGDEKLTYLGYSYGTRIGTEYAKQFPRNVRAMVLDGALDADEDTVDSLVNQGAGFQQAFDSFVVWCLEQPTCWLGDAPKEQANSRFQAVVRPLITSPVPVGNRALSYPDATTGAIQALYSDQLWPLLNQGLIDLATGDGTILLNLADVYYQRDGFGYSGSEDAFVAIRCLDDPPVTDPNVVREADRRYRQAAPFLDDGNPPSAARYVCAFWSVPPTSAPAEPKVTDLTRVLVISTLGDPATPYQAGVELARQLGAQLLSFVGKQHTVALQGVECVDEAVSNYLVRLELPEQTHCTA
ncbi:MAG: alpha/beta hydrolase [Pseudonocardiaceae bacterium]